MSDWNTETYHAALSLDGQPYEIAHDGEEVRTKEEVEQIIKAEIEEDYDTVAEFVRNNCGAVLNEFMCLLWQHIENINISKIVERELSD